METLHISCAHKVAMLVSRNDLQRSIKVIWNIMVL